MKLPDPDEQLRSWCKEHVRLSSLGEIKALDRKRFLQETGHFNVPPGERLRQLAIHAESEVPVGLENQPDGWCALRSIYEQALRFNEPDAWLVYASMAVSARRILEMGEDASDAWFADPARLARPHSDVRERIAVEAIEAGHRATELAPEQADAHCTLGRVYYTLGRNAEALACTEAAVAADPKHGWSALLRANTLSDLQRWEEAVRAYDAVPLDFFKGPIAWRVDWLKECRAWCKLQMGDREGALADFLAILSRYEAHPGLAYEVDPAHLVDAAAGPLRQELHDRTLALVQQLESTYMSVYLQRLESISLQG